MKGGLSQTTIRSLKVLSFHCQRFFTRTMKASFLWFKRLSNTHEVTLTFYKFKNQK